MVKDNLFIFALEFVRHNITQTKLFCYSKKFHDWILVNAWIWHVITWGFSFNAWIAFKTDSFPFSFASTVTCYWFCMCALSFAIVVVAKLLAIKAYIVCTILPVIFFVVFAQLSSIQTLLITTALSLSTNIGLLLFLCQSFSQISSTSLSITAAVITGCSLSLIYHFWTLDDLSLITIPPCINLTFWAVSYFKVFLVILVFILIVIWL